MIAKLSFLQFDEKIGIELIWMQFTNLRTFNYPVNLMLKHVFVFNKKKNVFLCLSNGTTC